MTSLKLMQSSSWSWTSSDLMMEFNIASLHLTVEIFYKDLSAEGV